MVGSVTEVQSHDEGKGGRSVTGVHRIAKTSRHGSVTGAWLHGLLEYVMYSCT